MSNIKKGYKQTELGVIPEDWEVKKLGDIAEKIVGGGTPSRLNLQYWGGDIPWVTVKDFATFNPYYSQETITKEGLACSASHLIPKGTLITSTRMALGKAVIYKVDVSINQDLKAFFTAKDVDTLFLYYWFQKKAEYIDMLGSGSTVKGISLTDLRNIAFLKPSKPEQTAIATVLSDTDALIEHLKKLIAKKKAIKQGAMQQLLTGKKRLPGFSGEWKIKKMGEMFDFSGGYTASREQLSHNGFCYLHYGDIHGAKKTYIDVKKEFIGIPKLQVQLSNLSRKSLLNDGDVVFVDASEDDEGASRHVVIKNQNEIPFISGLHTIVAKSKDDSLDNDFKRYCFKSINIKSQFKFYAVGTKVSGISKSNIAKIELFFPIKAEQSAIATILSDMDAEIERLEQKRDKYIMLKQGMMRELLTGRIRLM